MPRRKKDDKNKWGSMKALMEAAQFFFQRNKKHTGKNTFDVLQEADSPIPLILGSILKLVTFGTMKDPKAAMQQVNKFAPRAILGILAGVFSIFSSSYSKVFNSIISPFMGDFFGGPKPKSSGLSSDGNSGDSDCSNSGDDYSGDDLSDDFDPMSSFVSPLFADMDATSAPRTRRTVRNGVLGNFEMQREAQESRPLVDRQVPGQEVVRNRGSLRRSFD